MISFDSFDEVRKLKLKQGLEKPSWLQSRKYVVSFQDIFLESKSLFWINHDTNLLLFDFFPYFQKWHFPYWKRKRRRETPKNFIWAMKQKWFYSLTSKYCTTNIWPNCKISPEYQMDCCLSHKNFVEGHSWKVPKFNENSVTRSGWFFVSFFSYFCCKAIYWIAKLLGWQCQVCKIPKSIQADDLLSEKTTVRILKNSNHLLICKECRATFINSFVLQLTKKGNAATRDRTGDL